MKELTVGKNDAGQRLDRFVGKAVPLLPESLLQKYIRLKRIKVNARGSKRDARLAVGDVIQLYINDEFFERPTERNSYLKVSTPRLDIVYEDENIILVDKKPGILYLKDRLGNRLPVKNHCRFCFNTIYNSNPLSLLDEAEEILGLRPACCRLNFTVESREETAAVLKLFEETYRDGKKGKENIPGFTRGHYRRGVE